MRLTLALSSCLCPGVQVFLAVGLYVANVVFAAGKADCGAEPEVLGWACGARFTAAGFSSASKCPEHSWSTLAS